MRLLALLAAGLFAGAVMADDKKDEKKVKDEEAILGTWKFVKFDDGSDREPQAEMVAMVAKFYFAFKKDGKMAVPDPSKKDTEKEGTFKLDPAAKTKAIDILVKGDKDTLGVYELDGDTLKLCTAPSGKMTRPTEFKADGKGTYVITLKRVKDEKKDK